ncbi:hypothetical protein CHS0354_018846 [Potamilus streckersoni]|uniref:Uncharacterized protein n=1 Tax=Potamilus streckersoni TaxID=2493646 RepID=A0AAE0SIY8_9BIVA|nr:hypothetical protein CHS0354_018846 [Potamilus streckersoni]
MSSQAREENRIEAKERKGEEEQQFCTLGHREQLQVPQMLTTSKVTMTITQQYYMEDMETQTDIAISETTLALWQAQALDELDATPEIEELTRDRQDTDEEVDDEGAKTEDKETYELVLRYTQKGIEETLSSQ